MATSSTTFPRKYFISQAAPADAEFDTETVLENYKSQRTKDTNWSDISCEKLSRWFDVCLSLSSITQFAIRNVFTSRIAKLSLAVIIERIELISFIDDGKSHAMPAENQTEFNLRRFPNRHMLHLKLDFPSANFLW